VYDSFGNIITQNGSLINPFTYTGREFDDESGLYYYRARYYDARIGRFLQEDSIKIIRSLNLFVYVDNNPINFTDPEGLQSITPLPFPIFVPSPIILPPPTPIIDQPSPMITIEPLSPRCEKIRDVCIDECSEDLPGPPCDQGNEFIKCMNKCMERNSC